MSNEVEPLRSSVVQMKIGSRTYNMVESRNCGTCMHPARFQIESKLLQNYGYPAVARFVSELNNQRRDGSVEEWPELTVNQIKSHWNHGHCPVEGQVQRALAEERARERGIELSDSMGQYIDHVVAQKAVLARGYELLLNGEIEPDVKDMLAASKLLGDSEKDVTEGNTIEQWQEFMAIYFNAVQSIVTRDQWQEIVVAIQSHPVFSDMQAKNDDTTIQDAEVIA